MRLTHDEYFLAMLRLVASRSTCARRQVGAIITSENHHVLATGYNGVPSGFEHCTDVPCEGVRDPSGDSSRCLAVHAEVNAILQCTRLDLARTLYTSCVPCFMCAKMLCNTPIKRVVAIELYADKRGVQAFEKAGIEVSVYGV